MFHTSIPAAINFNYAGGTTVCCCRGTTHRHTSLHLVLLIGKLPLTGTLRCFRTFGSLPGLALGTQFGVSPPTPLARSFISFPFLPLWAGTTGSYEVAKGFTLASHQQGFALLDYPPYRFFNRYGLFAQIERS